MKVAGDHAVEYSKLESSMSNDLSSFVFGGVGVEAKGPVYDDCAMFEMAKTGGWM